MTPIITATLVIAALGCVMAVALAIADLCA